MRMNVPVAVVVGALTAGTEHVVQNPAAAVAQDAAAMRGFQSTDWGKFTTHAPTYCRSFSSNEP